MTASHHCIVLRLEWHPVVPVPHDVLRKVGEVERGGLTAPQSSQPDMRVDGGGPFEISGNRQHLRKR